MTSVPDDLPAWLWLLHTRGIGRTMARRLLSHFGSPDALLAAPAGVLREQLGTELAARLQRAPDQHMQRLSAVMRWLQAAGETCPRNVLSLGDPAYPPRLLETPDPPLLLYLQGRADCLVDPAIGLVGSRQPTEQGRENAQAFAAALNQAGLTVVSGLARGIDAAAHRGSLDRPGRAVAVVGTGLDLVYPRQHHALAQRIACEGAILSEYPPGTPPLAAHFPQRNRIIAGLSLGILVVEAALRSGSLITARMALEAGREVFALPGSIHSSQSRGCHALIKQGALLVESVDDILQELGLSVQQPCSRPLESGDGRSDASDPVWRALGFDPVGFDLLLARTQWPAQRLQARLLELELDGQVARLPGSCFQRIAPA